ncbi:hypothetical protein PAPHI01_2180 [Pancytospora philotis]|nr:hypothetical protein PAPHI01_2180 [Pancytospora philotis]
MVLPSFARQGGAGWMLAASLLLAVASIVCSKLLVAEVVSVSRAGKNAPGPVWRLPYVRVYLLAHTVDLAWDALVSAFEHRLSAAVSSRFFRVVQRRASADPGRCAAPAEGRIEALIMQKNAIVSFYTEAGCRLPKHLLCVVLVLSQMYSARHGASALHIFTTLCLSYFFALVVSAAFRVLVRPKVSRAAVAKAQFAAEAFDDIEHIKYMQAEAKTGDKFNSVAANFYRWSTAYLLVSEVLRFWMRAVFGMARYSAVALLNSSQPSAVAGVHTWLKKLESTLLQMRNSLFMVWEHRAEWRYLHAGANCGAALVDNHAPCQAKDRALEAPDVPTVAIQMSLDIASPTDCATDKCTQQPCVDTTTAVVLHSATFASCLDRSAFHLNADSSMSDTATSSLPNIVVRHGTVHYQVVENSAVAHALAEVILGLRGHGGTVVLCGTNAGALPQDVRLSLVSYLPSFHEVFNKTVAYNVAYGSGLAEKQAIAALEALGLSSLFASFNGGYHTPAGDSGSALSNGQRQLVCLCRALLKDASVYLLSSPFQYLSSAWRERCQTAIGRMAGKTFIICELAGDTQE